MNANCRVRFLSLFEPLVPNKLRPGPPDQALGTMSAGHPLFGRLITAVNMRRRLSDHLGRRAAIIMFCSEGYPRVLMCPMRCHSRDGKFLSGYVFHILFIRASALSSLDGSFSRSFSPNPLSGQSNPTTSSGVSMRRKERWSCLPHRFCRR